MLEGKMLDSAAVGATVTAAAGRASGEGDGDGAALERAGGRNGTHAFDDDSPSRFETALEIDDGRDRSWSLDRGPKVL